MTLSKAVIGVYFSALLIWSTFSQDVEANVIGYPSLRPNLPAPCSPRFSNGCIKPSSPPYSRGCNPISYCCSKPPPKSMKEYKPQWKYYLHVY